MHKRVYTHSTSCTSSPHISPLINIQNSGSITYLLVLLSNAKKVVKTRLAHIFAHKLEWPQDGKITIATLELGKGRKCEVTW